MTKKLNYYIDMDGVLADFESAPKAMKRFKKEKGFFKTLEPTKFLLETISQLQDYSIVHILSTAPNEQAEQDKKEWLNQYLPNIPSENIHIVYKNSDKARFAKDNILIDDHTPNLLDWVANGGHAIKAIHKNNGLKGVSRELGITQLRVY